MSTALPYTIEVERGDSFALVVAYKQSNYTAIDLTGYSAELVTHQDFVTIPATVTIPTPSNGQVSIAMSSGQTLALVDKEYRLRITSGATVITLLEGVIHVT